MAARIKTLLDVLGNKLYPKTKTKAVYDDNGATLDSLLSAKQDSLSYDLLPTQSSDNVVKSGGMYNALGGLIMHSLSSTLTAGSTTITFSDVNLSSSVPITVFTDAPGVYPTAVNDSTSGQVVLTFKAQVANVNVTILFYTSAPTT